MEVSKDDKIGLTNNFLYATMDLLLIKQKKGKAMKLNYKRTILVGFAFFLISAFWQAYDSTIPVTLANKFGMSDGASGIIMALDNVLAVFMLPLFGALSDKVNTKYGKRTPFIVIGTVIAVISLLGLSLADNAQLKKIDEVSVVDDVSAMEIIYDSQKDNEFNDPDAKYGETKTYILSEKFTKEEFTAIKSTVEVDGKTETNKVYSDYVVPVRQAHIKEITDGDPSSLILFIAVLLILLLSMSTFRSPAVALMPDVTLKPLRSKGNAVINLMGTAGGLLVLVLGMVFKNSNVKNAMMSYVPFYLTIALIMTGALVVFILTVKEKTWADEMASDTIKFGIEDKDEAKESGEKRKLSKGEKISLILILSSVALWYFGYNAVTSKYSVYAMDVLGKDYNTTMLLAQAFAIISYFPAGIVASKIGRRKTILAGVTMLTAAFFGASFMTAESSTFVMNIFFALAGMGWATINVNSFPMVVELAKGGDVGKYTGYYYTASMAAQIVTPVLSGFLMDAVSRKVLFPYAAIFAGLAFVTMFFVKHGDSRPEAQGALESLGGSDD